MEDHDTELVERLFKVCRELGVPGKEIKTEDEALSIRKVCAD